MLDSMSESTRVQGLRTFVQRCTPELRCKTCDDSVRRPDTLNAYSSVETNVVLHGTHIIHELSGRLQTDGTVTDSVRHTWTSAIFKDKNQ